MYEVAIVPFPNISGFISIRDTSTEEIYVFPKNLCEIFGIDWKSPRKELTDSKR